MDNKDILAGMGKLAEFVTDPRAGKTEQEQLRTQWGEVRFAGPEPIDPVQHYRNALKKTQRPIKRQFGLVEKECDYVYGQESLMMFMEHPHVTEDGVLMDRGYRDFVPPDTRTEEEKKRIRPTAQEAIEAIRKRNLGVLSSISQGKQDKQGRPPAIRAIGECELIGTGLTNYVDPLAPLPEELVKKLTGKGE